MCNLQIVRQIVFECEGMSIAETLAVTPINATAIRLEETPLLSGDQFTFQDIIEVEEKEDGSLLCKRLIQLGGFRTEGYLLPLTLVTSEIFQEYLKWIESEGCHWEAVESRYVLISVPKDSSRNTDADIDCLLDDWDAALHPKPTK